MAAALVHGGYFHCIFEASGEPRYIYKQAEIEGYGLSPEFQVASEHAHGVLQGRFEAVRRLRPQMPR